MNVTLRRFVLPVRTMLVNFAGGPTYHLPHWYDPRSEPPCVPCRDGAYLACVEEGGQSRMVLANWTRRKPVSLADPSGTWDVANVTRWTYLPDLPEPG
ncbi:MAG: hypothetical protein AB7G11_02645 [Phycisphaerales bacterium]